MLLINYKLINCFGKSRLLMKTTGQYSLREFFDEVAVAEGTCQTLCNTKLHQATLSHYFNISI